MSKSWFLDVDPPEVDLKDQIRSIIGRDLGDVESVVDEAKAQGKVLQNGDGVSGKMKDLKVTGRSREGSLPSSMRNPAALAAS